jgi:ligand-binding sensor domain-containing protein
MNACTKDDSPTTEVNSLTRKEDTLKNYAPEVHFEISNRLLEGKHIDCIEPDYKGNTWISSGKDLYFFHGSEEKTYTLDFPILDISIAGDETLWIGTADGGLGHLSKDTIVWYTTANSDLPRDYIPNVEVGLDGRVWFSSCAYDLGGLVVYDGKKFTLFTPDNSILNQHIVNDIGVDHQGSIYFTTTGTVTKTKVYRIANNSWKCISNEDGFYWVDGFTVGPAGTIYLLDNFLLSSSAYNNLNYLFECRNNTWKMLESDFLSVKYSFFTAIKADRRNYCWTACLNESTYDTYDLHVYNGNSWEKAPAGLFLDDKISVIEVDNNNRIWIGTDKNGVFILNQ